MLFRPSELLPQVAELGLLTCVLGEQTRDGLLGAGRREDVLLAKEQALSEVRGLGTGLGLRGLLLVLMALSWRLFWRVRARVRDRAQVDDAVEARVVEQPAQVQVAEDTLLVLAVRSQRVPLALTCARTAT